ncbi:MAG: N-acyl homoserine lactonase family protein [Desulfarculaceae bacterium]|jgi:glyoxylase-like metal-dependent hydrolase (beta-lactamase superfamily II)
MSEHQVYALKFAGPLTSSGALLMWFKEWEEKAQRGYYIWCIQSEQQAVVVDAGVAPSLAAERKLAGYVDPAAMMERLGTPADQVEHLVLTHLHWDHINGVSLFPNATIYVQESEYRFWTQNPLAHRPPFASLADREALDFLASLQGSSRLVLTQGDQEILPGIRCVLAPGHSIGHQAVAVNTGEGTIILASDCGHLFRNFKEDWPSSIFVDMASLLLTYDKLRAYATSPDLIFPGHDLLMTDNFPQVAEDITRLA